MISSAPNWWIVSFNASTQKSASSVLEMRQANTLRVHQSIMATRYKNPLLIENQVMSAYPLPGSACSHARDGDLIWLINSKPAQQIRTGFVPLCRSAPSHTCKHVLPGNGYRAFGKSASRA